MKKQRFLMILAVLCLLAFALPFTAFADYAPDHANEWVWQDGEWYYYDANGSTLEDFHEINGVWYYFDGNGRMAHDEAVYSYQDYCWYAISADGANYMPLNVEGWNYAFGNYYYGQVENGYFDLAYGEVIWDGYNYYAFDWEHKMVAGDVASVYCGDNYGYVRANDWGVLYVDAWYEEDGEWYYYGADCLNAEGFQLIGGTWYYFNYAGRMLYDCYVYSEGSYYALSADGASYVLLWKEGWNEAFGNWYYMEYDEDGMLRPVTGEIITLPSGMYYIEYDGIMVADDYVSGWNEYDEYFYGYAAADGHILDGEWYLRNGKYMYALPGGELCEWGTYEINGSLYRFDEYLYDIPGEYGDQYIGIGGALYRNKWYYDHTGYPDEIGWVYFDNDGYRTEGVASIGAQVYYFDYYGIMKTNYITTYGGETWCFGADGVGTVWADGWQKDPKTNQWMYVEDGTLKDGVLELDGNTYFINDGYMSSNDYWWFYSEAAEEYICGLFGADGCQIKTPGWHAVNGSWYYVKDLTGALMEGWFGGYYMDPYMAANRIFRDYETNVWYAANNAGACTPLSGTGLFHIGYDATYYLINGVPVCNQWMQVGNIWYYFGDNGYAYKGEATIDGVTYLFNDDGQLHTSGWLIEYGYSDGIERRYAGIDGVMYTGLQTIDGVEYLFFNSGYVAYGGLNYYKGQYYLTNTEGAVLSKFGTEGWNQVGNDWYYVQDGSLVTNEVIEINGARYGFDDEGRMISNTIKYCGDNYHVFGADGVIAEGWTYTAKGWAYEYYDAEFGYGHAYNGWYTIDGNEYFFDNFILKTGTFFAWGEYIVTTDANGVIIDQQEIPDGWTYNNDDGVVYYMANGTYYNGWIGDYYIENGCMVWNEVIEYNGWYFYIGVDGRCVYNGWYETPYNGFIYARADGTLYCSEWLQLGSNYFYFYNYTMVTGREYIDGQLHQFDEFGVWQGVIDESTEIPSFSAEGWNYANGNWYYVHAGETLIGTYYIDGKYYYFNSYSNEYDNPEALPIGAMVTNTFAEGQRGAYYYGADGAACLYNGWQWIDGSWCYFNADGTVRTGMFMVDGVYYYNRYFYYENEDGTVTRTVGLVCNEYRQFGDRLYYFDASGACYGAVTGTGWMYIDGIWYYLSDGILCRNGWYEIDGGLYYFDYDGWMFTDAVVNGSSDGYYNDNSYRYVGVDGQMVTTSGWYYSCTGWASENGWVYVKDNGYVCYNGVYLIDGVQYTFIGGRLVG